MIQDFDEINLVAKHCVRLDHLWREKRKPLGKRAEEKMSVENRISDCATKCYDRNVGTRETYTKQGFPHPSGEGLQLTKQDSTAFPMKKFTDHHSRNRCLPVDYAAVGAIKDKGNISTFNNIVLPKVYGRMDDCKFETAIIHAQYVARNEKTLVELVL